MFIFVLSAFLGICGIIQPEQFEIWRIAMTIELIFDFPMTLFGLWLSNKLYDIKNESNNNYNRRKK